MSDFVASVSIWLPGVIVMLALVLVSGFCSASETALFFLSRDEIRSFSQGTGRQKMAASLMSSPDRVLTAILFWNLLVNLAYFSLGLVVMHKLSHGGFTRVAAVLGVANLLGIIAFGEVLPKSLAAEFRCQLAPLVSWPLALMVAALDPVIPLLGQVAKSLRLAFWHEIKQEPHIHPEDLEQAIDASAAMHSDMLDIEQQVLHNILDLSEIRVEEVMRPRNHCLIVRPDDTFETLKRSIQDVDYLLIQEPTDDHVSRVVALSGISTETHRRFRQLSEAVIFVPWCASLAWTFSELQRQYCGVAVIVHEMGEMVGVVTYEDILETMLTESPSRTRRILRREPLIPIGPGRYHADGLVTLRYLASHLRVEFDPDEDSQYTINGLFHDQLERLAVMGDVVVWKNWRLTVIDVAARGKVRVLVELPSSAGLASSAASTTGSSATGDSGTPAGSAERELPVSEQPETP
jgi:CBS domain containing-hemolysin-like protein